MVSPYVFPGIKELHKSNCNFKLKRNEFTPQIVMELVANNCGLTVNDIVSKTRKSMIVDARYIFCGIMKKYFNYPYKNIGDFVGHRDHTTAIHAVKTFQNRYDLEEGYRELVESIVYDLNIKFK